MGEDSSFLAILKNRINLVDIPFTDRGSRLLIFKEEQHLNIRLAERWYKRTGDLSAYRRRPPLVDNWYFTDGNGNRLESTLTSYPDRLEFLTILGVFTIVFNDIETLLLALPPVPCGITFLANLDIAQVDRRGGIFHLSGDIRRNLAYTTNAKILRNEIKLVEPGKYKVVLMLKPEMGESLLINITPRLGFNRYMPNLSETLKAVARRWHEWFASAPLVLDQYKEQYYFAWWIMCAGLISTRYYITREAMTPSKVYYVGIWQWDAYFHALAYRHIDVRLAEDQLRILLDHQLDDGMIPDAIHDEGIVTHLDLPVNADVTKPPLVAWAAWKIYEKCKDKEFLQEIYQPISRWNQWWFDHNDRNKNGLCEYMHPFSSGLDDNPLWDDGMPVESPDLNTYLCIQQDALAKIADVIGLFEEADTWRRRAEDIAQRMIRTLWDENAGLFWAKKNGIIVNVRTPFNLFPLLTNRMPKNIMDQLVSQLTDKQQFWPKYPIPSVAINDPKYNPNQMWRGPTWVNINYLFIEGLRNSGYIDAASALCTRTLELIGGQLDIYEYYNPETGKNPEKAAPVFGWTSAVYIDLAITASLNSC